MRETDSITPIVTCLDEAYFPGIVPLHNSYLQNSGEGFSFHAIVEGSDELARAVEDLGIHVIQNPEIPVDRLPEGKHAVHQRQMPAMYYRLLIPDLFPDNERSVYIDADAIILKSLKPLVEMPFKGCLAATRCNSPIDINVHGRSFSFTHGPMSSWMIYDHKAWSDLGIFQKCVDAMNDPGLHFPFTVQGVLQCAVGEDWHKLNWDFQPHAGHDTYARNPRAGYVLHFMGTNPWDVLEQDRSMPHKHKAREIWSGYL